MMEPTQLYNHSKRNLLVFATILALVLFRGIEATNSAQLFGFKVRPEVLPTVLFFVVGYLVYQFFLARTFQADELRNRIWLWLDFAITTGFASVVLLGYLILYITTRLRGSEIVPYIPHPMPVREPEHIAEIVVGPAAPADAERAVRTMLATLGLDPAIEVSSSDIPYRAL
jgi:hypothetical protein